MGLSYGYERYVDINIGFDCVSCTATKGYAKRAQRQ